MQQQNDNISELFSAALLKARGRVSQKEFAEYLGIGSQQTYGNYERGRVPKTHILTTISKRIGVSIEQLLRGEVPHNAMDRGKFIAEGVSAEIATHMAAGPTGAAERMTDEELLEGISEHVGRFLQDKPYMKAAHAEVTAALAQELHARHSPRLVSTAKVLSGEHMKPPHKNQTSRKEKRSRLRDDATVSLYIFGSLPAGWPDPSEGAREEQALRVVQVPRGHWPEGAFGLDVRGDSMNAAKPKPIPDGCTVVLVSPEDREPKSGDIVAALIDGETCLKRLVNGDQPAYLKSESSNPAHGSLHPKGELTIQGVFWGILEHIEQETT